MSELIVGAIIVALCLYAIIEYFSFIQTCFYILIGAGFCWVVGFVFLKLMKGFWG